MKFKEDLGSIFVTRDVSDERVDIYFGYRDNTGSHAHAVIIDGALEHYRTLSGLNPVITGIGSVYF